MIPNITIGARTISPYMIMALIGIFVAGPFVVTRAKKDDRLEFLTMLLWSSIGVIAGGGLLYGITNIKHVITAIGEGESFWTILSYFGGSVFYGGMLGGVITAKIYCTVKHIDITKYIDIGTLFIPFFHVFGRIGCFLSGCCFGAECSFGFVYHHSPIAFANEVCRFPVQLVESAGNLVIFLVLYNFRKNGRFKNKLLYVYFVSYACLRFTLEFFRGDYYRGFLFGLSTSQIISIILFIIGAYNLFIRKNKKSAEPQKA